MNIKFNVFVFAFLFCFSASAKNVDSYSLFGAPKYKNFTHFEYVNENAPKGGRVVMPEYGSFDNFNPYIFKGNAARNSFLFIETLGISPVDDSSTLYPLIAKEFEVSDDGSFMGFIIDENARFSDGSKITADDVVFSFESIINKGAPVFKMYYSDVIGVKKISDKHVRFMFNKASKNKELPIIVGNIPIFSKKHFENVDFSKPSLTPPLGSGPYVIKDFEQGKFIVFERNENYWAKEHPTRKGMFNFDKIKFDYYSDTSISKEALFANNIDIREEYIAKTWATGYDNNLIKDKKIIKEEIDHNNPPPLQSFVFNTRKDMFKDKRVRQAINLAFDFDWANKNLFYNQYKRLSSYFTNTGFEYKNFNNPSHKDYMSTRNNLKQAVELLSQAGYGFVDGKMVNLKTKEPLSFEIFDNSNNGSSFTRVMLPFINNLKKIGIDAKFRSVEVNIFKNRLDNFDFDVCVLSYPVSKNPGSELREYFGSKAADVEGGYNLIGIKNKKIDDLIEKVISSDTKKEYAKNIEKLDKTLLEEYYLIFNWYSAHNRVAYWDKLKKPKTNIKTGFLPHTWWMENEK